MTAYDLKIVFPFNANFVNVENFNEHFRLKMGICLTDLFGR